VLQDLRFTLRLLAKERWFAALGTVVLALGIGVNAVGFTVVNAAFLRGLPFSDADRLLTLAWQGRPGRRSVSHADLQDWRAQSRTFAGLAAFRNEVMNLSDARAYPEQVRGTRMTANAFTLLRQPALLGRGFAADDDLPGAAPVAVVSHRVWQQRYGADPNVLGTPVRVNGAPATIVGVMPDRMNFPDNTELWLPFVPTETQKARSSRILSVFGRLEDGASRDQAQAEMNAIATRIGAAYVDVYKDVTGVRIETFTERYVGGSGRIMFLVMMGAVSFVLLIACANVANLLVARSAQRARELAVRLALGATRWRVVRQLLLESVVLGCIGGSIGLLLAAWGARTLNAAIQDPGKPYWIDFTVDYAVFGYVAAICVLTGIIFGLAPALHVAKANVNDVLKEGGRGSAGSRRVRALSGVMVVVELALTVVLLAGAGLMLRSFLKIYALEIGIDTDRLLTMRFQLQDSKYAMPAARRAFYERLQQQLAGIPGVDAVAVTTAVPPFGSGQRDFEIDGRPARTPDEPLNVSTVTISPEFFDVVGVQLRQGRGFHERDGAPGGETVIINERMALLFFPGEDPIGKRIRFRTPATAGRETTAAPWSTIVGISPTIRQGATTLGGEPNAVVYLTYRQDPPAGAALLVRSQLPPASVVEAMRRGVQAIDSDQPVFGIQTVEQLVAEDRWPFRVFGAMFTIFAVIALVLSSAGLYGVMAYSVTQRTQEIGIRMALGADGRQMSWLILRRGLWQLGIGLALGLPAALAFSRALRTVLVQISPGDPVTFVTIAVVLTVVSVAACVLPARRATRVDPLIALRAE
jgi:putative ABC transport system permease protein